MNPILIYLLVFLALFISYGLGVLTSIYFVMKATKELEADDEEEEKSPDLYCFQCEMEMSTVVKNGNLHCGNCGLKH